MSFFLPSYSDREQLQAIYGAYLKPVLHKQIPGHPIWNNPSKVHAMACSMVQMYEQLKSSFSVDDFGHYLFTPRDLTQWVLSLLRSVPVCCYIYINV